MWQICCYPNVYIYIFVRADSVSSLLGQHSGFLISGPPPIPAGVAKNHLKKTVTSLMWISIQEALLVNGPLTVVNASSLPPLSSSHFGNAGC